MSQPRARVSSKPCSRRYFTSRPRVAESQGGDPDSVWSALCNLSGKILNRHSNIQNHIGTDVLSVVPTEDFAATSALRGTPEAVALDENTKRL